MHVLYFYPSSLAILLGHQRILLLLLPLLLIPILVCEMTKSYNKRCSCMVFVLYYTIGAHQQPWHFSVVSSQDLKARIREAVEEEEQVNYDRRMKQSWKDNLAPIFKNSALHKDG